ncbi:hypothetical protein JYJ95_38415 [Corallococcus exiguus]|uniref:YopT-type cysteine protease domain-containing protein n=1 Tax=Corallococcus exiguus TaxID=83462 RepID=UPI001A8CF020|nr:hypothetical protein [Corallococcus exiguus]
MEFPVSVVKHSAARTAFSQDAYVGGVERDGFCAALSFAWCRQLLKQVSGAFGVPQELPALRIATLRKAAPELIKKQRVYSAKQKAVQRLIPRITMALDVSNILSEQGFMSEGKALFDATMPVWNEVKSRKIIKTPRVEFPRALQELAQDNHMRITNVLKVPSFKEVDDATAFATDKLESKCAHVLGLERFHAIAVYRTGGFFSTDFYFFDPNCGEFHCKGHIEAGFALYALLHTVPQYNQYKELFSFLVKATG